MNDELLSAHGVGKTYSTRSTTSTALDDVSLEVRAGDRLAITGRSGSGKSTLMHVLSLLHSPTSGDVRVAGQPASGMSERQKDRVRNERFGFVFQNFQLDHRQSVADNVSLPLRIAGKSRAAARRRSLDLLDRFGLAALAARRAGDLSGGQKQRVAISRALANEPQILFADEPTGSLDSQNAEVVAETLLAYPDEGDTALVLVTHDDALARRCSRVMRVQDGRLADLAEAVAR